MTLDRCLVVASGFCLDTRPSLLRMSSQVPEWGPRSSEKPKDEARTLRTMSRIAVQTSGSTSKTDWDLEACSARPHLGGMCLWRGGQSRERWLGLGPAYPRRVKAPVRARALTQKGVRA